MDTGYAVRDYDVNDIRDAERLARMFGTFDSAWPGGFNHGVEFTPQHLYDEMRQMQRLAICVVQYQDDMVGYCDLHAQSGDTDLAYIPLLGADPGHHGKGVGKMLLLEMVRRVANLGFRELTLNTWAGNLKAVPLYKKTGFHWEPETNVFMRNFIPRLLNSAVGKEFFAGRDWYQCMERDLSVSPDDVKWNGMRVFPYTFREGSDYLKATFEMASGGLTALETNKYSVSCSVPTLEGHAPAGDSLPIIWNIEPKSGEALDLVLLTDADDGLETTIQERMRITETTELRRTIRVSDKAAPRHSGERERCVRSTLILNGVPVVLETGVEVVRPISIEFSGQGLFPGRAERVVVQLQSNLDRPVSGTVSMDSHPGLLGSGTTAQVTLQPRMSVQCAHTLTGASPGVYYTNMRFDFGEFKGVRPLTFRVYGGLSAITSLEPNYDEVIVSESAGIKITHSLRGGALKIKNKSAGSSVQLMMPEPGPPFASMRRRKPVMTGRVEISGSDETVVLAIEYPELPGVVVERRVLPMAGDLVRIDYRISNATNTSANVKLRTQVRGLDAKVLALPQASGVVREPRHDWDSYPAGDGDALKSPTSLAEGWLAGESDQNVCGLVWHGQVEIETNWGTALTVDAGEVAANSSINLPPLYCVVGRGDWESVRGWWRHLIQPADVIEKQPKASKRVLNIQTEHSPLLLTADTSKTQLIVTNERGKPVSGSISLDAGKLQVSHGPLVVTAAARDKPGRFDVEITESCGYGAGYIRASLKTSENTQPFKLPVIRIASPGSVSLTEDESGAVLVQNGLFEYRVSASFLGSVTALSTQGKNHLHSSYPNPGPFVWSNPWYGGIHPYLDWMGDEQLTREEFTGEQIEIVGDQGNVWKGVRVTCRPKHRNLRWLKIEADYLTLPASDLMAVVFRRTNLDSAEHRFNAGIAVWTCVGADRSAAVAHWSNKGELRHRNRSRYGLETETGRWAAVENPMTGDRLEVVTTGSRVVSMDDMGEEGVHFGIADRYTLDAGETQEALNWIVVNPAAAEFEAYAELNKVTSLP